ncbi:MAG: glycerophosphodiester phosphodiesterase, partial [Gammaproteobacteria bacterium]
GVLAHDQNLQRRAGKPIDLAQTTFRELSQIFVDVGFEAQTPPAKLPSLADAIIHARKLSLGLVIELKLNTSDGTNDEESYRQIQAEHTVAALVQTLRQLPFQHGPLLCSSFSVEAITYIHQRLPHIPRALTCRQLPEHWQQLLHRLQLDQFHLHRQAQALHQQDLLQSVQATGTPIYCFTVNQQQEFEQLMQMGITGVFTDKPLILPTSEN